MINNSLFEFIKVRYDWKYDAWGCKFSFPDYYLNVNKYTKCLTSVLKRLKTLAQGNHIWDNDDYKQYKELIENTLKTFDSINTEKLEEYFKDKESNKLFDEYYYNDIFSDEITENELNIINSFEFYKDIIKNSKLKLENEDVVKYLYLIFLTNSPKFNATIKQMHRILHPVIFIEGCDKLGKTSFIKFAQRFYDINYDYIFNYPSFDTKKFVSKYMQNIDMLAKQELFLNELIEDSKDNIFNTSNRYMYKQMVFIDRYLLSNIIYSVNLLDRDELKKYSKYLKRHCYNFSLKFLKEMFNYFNIMHIIFTFDSDKVKSSLSELDENDEIESSSQYNHENINADYLNVLDFMKLSKNKELLDQLERCEELDQFIISDFLNEFQGLYNEDNIFIYKIKPFDTDLNDKTDKDLEKEYKPILDYIESKLNKDVFNNNEK